jgi:hypothetical protein
MALMEQQMEALEQQVHHLEATKRFDRQLEAGESPPGPPGGSGGEGG